jgi:hypothetical protein
LQYLDNWNTRKALEAIRRAAESTTPNSPPRPAPMTAFAIAPYVGSSESQPETGIPVAKQLSTDDVDNPAQDLANTMELAWTEWPSNTSWAIIATAQPPTGATSPLVTLPGATVITTFRSSTA